MLTDIRELLVREIRELYHAETLLLPVMDELLAAAQTDDLRQHFVEGKEVNMNNVDDLAAVCQSLKVDPLGYASATMECMIQLSRQGIMAAVKPEMRDLTLSHCYLHIIYYRIGCLEIIRALAHAISNKIAEQVADDCLAQARDMADAVHKTNNGGFFSKGLLSRAKA